jgi:opacity protein-like surface antigen
LTAVLFPCDSQAQLYLGAEGGWTGLPDQTDTILGLTSFKARFDGGFNAGVRGGWEWGPWRFEEEYSYRQNGARDLLVGPGFSIKGVGGNRHSNSIMTNVLYDFTVGYAITPHVGFGVGAVDVFDGLKLPGIGQLFNNSSWQFGYQGIAGIRYNLSPTFTLDLDYRYLATTQPTFNIPNTNLRYRTGYHTNNFVASLIYRFAPPPPPAPAPVSAPPPAPPPPQVFLVFFDWDRADITPAGMDILRQAANAYKAGGSVRLQVTGYTDLSGSAGYNQRLSLRRANNVAKALANLGVARNDMAVSGRGENDPRVPTAQGVREPQNRRVEIVFAGGPEHQPAS